MLDVHGPLVLPAGATHSTLRLGEREREGLAHSGDRGRLGSGSLDVTLSGPAGSVTQTLALRIEPGTGRALPAHRAAAAAAGEPDGLEGPARGVPADDRRGLASRSRRSRRSTCRACCRRSTAILTAAPSRSVSRAMPLLYVNQLASSERLGIEPISPTRVDDAIERVLSRQDSNGSFGLWSVGGDDIWLDAYVTRLPDARPRGRNSPCRRSRFQRPSTACATTSSTTPRSRPRTRRPRLCGLCAGAQRPAGDRAICAISPTPSSTSSTRPWRAPRSPRRWRCSATAAAPGKAFASACELPAASKDGARIARRLRLAPARRRRPVALAAESGRPHGDHQGGAGRWIEEARRDVYTIARRRDAWMVLAAEGLVATRGRGAGSSRRRRAARAPSNRAFGGGA